MHILNIGILAHVDAGKTSLTERLLFETGVITRLGSVDGGSTQTDTGEIERRRGITIRSAVASFTLGDLRVNLVDTPGHADFVAEVERALGVLDGAVLVVSAVEGVQPHTRVLMKTLRRLRLPTLIFVNKVDRMGAREAGVLAEIRRWLSPRAVPLNTVTDIGVSSAATCPYAFAPLLAAGHLPADRAAVGALPVGVAARGGMEEVVGAGGLVEAAGVTALPDADGLAGGRLDAEGGASGLAGVGEAAEVLADGDDGLLELLVDGVAPVPGRVRAALAAQCAAGEAHPVVFGSAITGQGVAELLGAVRLLPSVAQPPYDDEPYGPTATDGPAPAASAATAPAPGTPEPRPAGPQGAAVGVVFAVERGRSGEKVGYVRLWGGGLRGRERVTFLRGEVGGGVREYDGRPTAVVVVGSGARRAVAGDIAKVWGVPEIRVGDRLREPGPAGQAHFAPPSLETVVRPRLPGHEPRLHAALIALAEQDPLIATRTLPGGETSVLLYGEVQKEVIGETLARDFDVEAVFEPSRPVYFERPSGTGEAREEMRHAGGAFMATVGLRVEPVAPGSGVVYRLEVDLGSLPLAFHRAIEESVRHTLGEGPHGWPVTDVLVALTATGYASPVTVAGDFRGQARAVLTDALRRAGTRVYEPCHRFELEVPADAFNAVSARLAGLGAVLDGTSRQAETWVLEGEIPAAAVHEAERRLPGLSHGEGVWWSQPSGDRPVRTR
ncbi:TetM/TetW/TetO/TetS family tetracycline resistance ribosomal protection protein [Nonomuraea sp. WAC 01424]|uniref:TetM/TetW/TetO/TetS family tetracycline resistance ribosomal protection protein n=1 Tax=Nonomuraea sp. WAC 01424 TaxID=2203200 RepID=UPI0026C7A6D0|nr:TetM/TetW/TetO/TetS family tetracycline resistance ribosomal protection protein [Nonomuraea sp. WAC 01424]